VFCFVRIFVVVLVVFVLCKTVWQVTLVFFQPRRIALQKWRICFNATIQMCNIHHFMILIHYDCRRGPTIILYWYIYLNQSHFSKACGMLCTKIRTKMYVSTNITHNIFYVFRSRQHLFAFGATTEDTVIKVDDILFLRSL